MQLTDELDCVFVFLAAVVHISKQYSHFTHLLTPNFFSVVNLGLGGESAYTNRTSLNQSIMNIYSGLSLSRTKEEWILTGMNPRIHGCIFRCVKNSSKNILHCPKMSSNVPKCPQMSTSLYLIDKSLFLTVSTIIFLHLLQFSENLIQTDGQTLGQMEGHTVN